MKPVPIVFHLGPLQVHTYGIGLAITFGFALVYATRRLSRDGFPTIWLNRAFLWIVGSAIVGARVVHVVANFTYYTQHPGLIVAVWQGGLSSWGGLLFAVPTGLWLTHRYCPTLRTWQALDLVAPVLMAAWAMGRLIGPNFEINGGGLPTHAWYGLQYAGQSGYRIPVPLFQAADSFGVWGVLIALEHRLRLAGRWWAGPTGGGPAASRVGLVRLPLTGLVFAAMVALWSLERFFEEYLWLAQPPLWDAVEVTGLVMSLAGLVAMAVIWRRGRFKPAPVATPPGGASPTLQAADAS